MYVRYRHGFFYANVGPGEDQYVNDPTDTLATDLGGPFDGDMTIGKMREITAGFLDFSDAEIEDDYEATMARMAAEDEQWRREHANDPPTPPGKFTGTAVYWDVLRAKP